MPKEYKYLKEIPALKLFELQKAVCTAQSNMNGAWEELAGNAGFDANEICQIVSYGNNPAEWTKNFFSHWLLRRPTLEDVARAMIATSLHEAVKVLEPLCTGEALRIIREWLQNQQAHAHEYVEADTAVAAVAGSLPPQQIQPPGPGPFAAGDHVLEYHEDPHGFGVNAPAELAGPSHQQQASEPLVTSCLGAPAQRVDEDAQPRFSCRPGEFCGIPAQQLHLVTLTEEARAYATKLRGLHQRLFHPHLAPLLGSQDWPGSMDLYFPQYTCTLEGAYSRHNRRGAQAPVDFDSRLRVLFGVAKALLYLHGSPGGERFLLGNLASSTVMLDRFSCPVIFDLTALRELPPWAAEDACDFSADVAAFRLLGLELFTGLSRRKEPKEFEAALQEIRAMAASDPESRTQMAFDSDRMVPPEMQPPDPEGDEELSAQAESEVLMMYFRYQLIVCSLLCLDRSLDSFAGSMRVSKYFGPVWSSM